MAARPAPSPSPRPGHQRCRCRCCCCCRRHQRRRGAPGKGRRRPTAPPSPMACEQGPAPARRRGSPGPPGARDAGREAQAARPPRPARSPPPTVRRPARGGAGRGGAGGSAPRGGQPARPGRIPTRARPLARGLRRSGRKGWERRSPPPGLRLLLPLAQRIFAEPRRSRTNSAAADAAGEGPRGCPELRALGGQVVPASPGQWGVLMFQGCAGGRRGHRPRRCLGQVSKPGVCIRPVGVSGEPEAGL